MKKLTKLKVCDRKEDDYIRVLFFSVFEYIIIRTTVSTRSNLST